MNALAKISSPAVDVTPEGMDYDTVRRVIELITLDYRAQPSLDAIAADLGQSPTQLQKVFTRWAGLSPKAFLQAVTLDHAKRLLGVEGLPLLETSYELGLSGPGRLHDLFVTHEAMSPGEWKARGGGLTIRYGFHPSPFGRALVMATDRGLAGLAFADGFEDQQACLDDMTRRWPNAVYVEDAGGTADYIVRVFDRSQWSAERPLQIVLIGTDFQVKVWRSLLKIPFGKTVTYSHVACDIGQPTASRAVGAAVGANPISFVVPCHRAVGKSGALTGYHWGLTRKRAILGWEAGNV
ncbi:AraC family transcriptional regulator of adaptative response/methylated-DNA-[protein]-cysteine methyltransferase [Neorhizobium huautlense]|uniref:AraC family transcriptional regulator of adaptative response/methylated-DNA-[protein]-cysteine methyltransferase n=1 Tax=Neorhizobium huautlense TaxID=67774 RepID=A0ABT9PNI3_9HYPH|nr:bifunctional helix-turn-helix domain-containing protein/methylated-DNA--[protein]-cysteine S-methyltransferase [Neorhizobium huautlense]MDP9836021.1 AraC family transcriptional regulator of adaptative response/methylated-DNA-[protein]-cysteine methyltransferase [Neorhizobium huautlense]